jgi:hypothetical protein
MENNNPLDTDESKILIPPPVIQNLKEGDQVATDFVITGWASPFGALVVINNVNSPYQQFGTAPVTFPTEWRFSLSEHSMGRGTYKISAYTHSGPQISQPTKALSFEVI